MKTVLILGSAPNAVNATQFDLSRVDALVALNNAWSIRTDWSHAIFPEDFPQDRRPAAGNNQEFVTHKDYVPANNAYGGIIYAGATMAFTAAYWTLSQLRPNLLFFYGCDMIYDQPGGKSHFYGTGVADPLRDDPTLQSLEAKANRLLALAAQDGCICANLSDLPESRLTFPRFDAAQLDSLCATDQQRFLLETSKNIDDARVEEAIALERAAAQFHADGDYWNADFEIDTNKLKEIDAVWLRACQNQSDVVIS